MRETARISLLETKNYITHISDDLTQSFKEVIGGDWGLDQLTDMNNVFLIDIEIFADGYGLVLYPSDKEATQLGYKKLLEKYSDGPLRDDNYRYGLDFSSYDLENEKDSKEIDDYYKSLSGFYFEWIANCWDNAGGSSFLKPIYVMMHDGAESFNLQNKNWVTDQTKWSQ
ncbi:MAG: hypothetical protein ABIN36_05275 [Ferruginibacter sp.]